MAEPVSNQTDSPAQQLPSAAVSQKSKNTLGLVAAILGVVGFIFACIPGALIVGWILLPIAFILGLVAVFQKGKKKGMAVTAIILAVVGTIVGIFVFLGSLASAVSDAISDGGVSVETPSGDGSDESQESVTGTRENPVPIGSAISSNQWTVVVNSVTLDATSEVMAENQFNDEPAAGNQYALVNYTITYTGDDPQGAVPWANVSFVTSQGNVIDSTSSFAVIPNQIDLLPTLFSGASVTGNVGLEIPTEGAADGVLAVQTTLGGDKVFVAVQ